MYHEPIHPNAPNESIPPNLTGPPVQADVRRLVANGEPIMAVARTVLRREDCILMQYTGRMEERRGKIWEGDVVRLDVTSDTEELDNYSQYSYIAYHQGGFAFFPVGRKVTAKVIRDLNDFDLFFMADSNDDKEIRCYRRVGSMHEETELLKLKGLQPLGDDPIRPR